MKLRILIVLSILLCFIKCDKFLKFYKNVRQNVDENLTQALEAVISSHPSYTLRIIGTRGIFSSFERSLNSSSGALELLTKENFINTSIILKTSCMNVIVLENLTDINKIFIKENIKYFQLDALYVLLSIEACNEPRETDIFKIVWHQQISNIILICKENDEILMKTFYPYQKGKCGSTDSVVVNKFINYSWEDEKKFFPLKFRNLHNCQLKVGSFLYPPITMREALPNGTFRYYGSEFEILKELSQILNFDINHNYNPQTGSSGLLFDNGTATGILRQAIDGELDIIMSFYYLTYQRSKFLSFTQSHYSVPLVIMIPMGRPFTAFEKLFKPFQLILWSVLVLTLAIALVTIAIINCQKEGVKKFVFGNKIDMPYMNFFNILINGIQDVMPKRTFARYLLMMFMIFCFVLRAIYQGSLYQFLQADDRKPNMERIDEMMKNNFVFYIRETLEHNIKNMSFYDRRKVVKFSDYPALREKTLDSQFKGGIIMPLLEVILVNQQTYKNFTYKVLKEYLFDVQIVYYYPKNFHLVNLINEKIGILKSAGIISMWMDRYIDKTFVNIKTPRIGPKIINIEQLLGGFEIWTFGMCLGIVAFGVEMLTRFEFFRILRKIFNKL